METWRLTDSRFTKPDGEGARLYGGRWNSPGHAAVYTSLNLSLAVLEALVHLDQDLVPGGYVSLRIEVPGGVSIKNLNREDLPANWNEPRAGSLLRKTGDAWLEEATSAGLMVPSVIVPEEFSLILNPDHPEMARIRVIEERPFRFDRRLIT